MNVFIIKPITLVALQRINDSLFNNQLLQQIGST